MTSSSSWPAWVPSSLAGSAGSRRAPSFDPLVVQAVPPGLPGWLRPLRTTLEQQAEADRATRRDDDFQRGADEASRRERLLAQERCDTALLAVQRVADHLELISTGFARDRERDLHGLAIAVARQIVQHELMIDPLRVGELVRRALELMPLDSTLEIRLHPDDLATLGTAVEQLLPQGRQVHLHWLADPAIDRGDFVLESPQRIVDGRADAALRDLYERLEHD